MCDHPPRAYSLRSTNCGAEHQGFAANLPLYLDIENQQIRLKCLEIATQLSNNDYQNAIMLLLPIERYVVENKFPAIVKRG